MIDLNNVSEKTIQKASEKLARVWGEKMEMVELFKVQYNDNEPYDRVLVVNGKYAMEIHSINVCGGLYEMRAKEKRLYNGKPYHHHTKTKTSECEYVIKWVDRKVVNI